MKVVDRMVDEFGRKGKAAGAGFYDYPAGDGKAKKTLWPGLWDQFVDPAKNPVSDEVFHDLQERFTFVMSLETIRCVDEGVLRSTRRREHRFDLRYRLPAAVRRRAAVRQQLRHGGERVRLPARARELAAAYGPQFEPPPCSCGRPRRESASSKQSHGPNG